MGLMYNAIMSLSYIGSLLYMAMNDYQELLSSYVAQNNELQVAMRSKCFDLRIFISGITRTVVTQDCI